MSDQMMEQAVRASRGQGMSSIKEVVSSWGDVARFLRGGDSGSLVPVVIPKDKRGLRWTGLIWFAVWALVSGIILMATGGDIAGGLGGLAIGVAVVSVLLAALWWWRSSIVEIEEGTVGVLTKFGAISGPGLSPGRVFHRAPRGDPVARRVRGHDQRRHARRRA